MFSARWGLFFLLLGGLSGCHPGRVRIGEPSDRYDHNRSASGGEVGLMLPVSAASAPAPKESDRSDLLDFLGSGPMAHAGLERTDLAGALPEETEKLYPIVLRLLSDASLLSKDKEALKSWAEGQRLCTTSRVRAKEEYPPFAFSEVLAIYGGDFWFVLYRLPSEGAFTRLVVVPISPTRKDLDGKGPSRTTTPGRPNDCAR